MTVREINIYPLANASKFLAGQVKNCPGQVELLYTTYKGNMLSGSAPEISFHTVIGLAPCRWQVITFTNDIQFTDTGISNVWTNP